jgi:hypothetical protein
MYIRELILGFSLFLKHHTHMKTLATNLVVSIEHIDM